MKKIVSISCIILLSFVLIFSCKKEDDPTNDNPDVQSIAIDSTLKSFYTTPPVGTSFESIFYYSFNQAPLNINNTIFLNLYWYAPVESYGIYWHFNNSIGDVLCDDNGFVKGFDSGIKIDSTLAGTWRPDAALSLDYVANPTANKGNLAGQGDKYIVFRAFEYDAEQLKYYGWLRVTVSDNGRDIKVHSLGYQKNANTSLKTGEL